MLYCVVKNCDSWKQKENGYIKFFRFPKKNNIKEIWIKACGQASVNHKTGRICSLHFTDDDWTLKDKLLNTPIEKRHLKENAIPTINIFNSPINTERSVRQQKRETKKIVEDILKDSNQRESEEIAIDEEAEAAFEYMEIENVTSVKVQTEVDLECAREFKIMALEKEIKALKKQNKLLKDENCKLKNLETSVSRIFSKSQISRLKNPGKNLKWTLEDISAAARLHSAGPQAYGLLYSKKFPLPGTSTLRHWATKLNVRAGLLHDVLKLMKQYAMNENDKLTVLTFDKMKIKREKETDKGNEQDLSTTNVVQVVLARGLFANWNLPIFYDYGCQMSAHIMIDIIAGLDAAGFCVVALVSDMSATNIELLEEFEITTTKTYFQHPSNPAKKIFVFADIPHLMKLFRNQFIDTGFIWNGKTINKNPILQLIKAKNNSDLDMALKITSEHLNVKHVDRQKLKTVTQLLSHTVSEAIKKCVALGICNAENSVECADLIKAVKDWYNVFNTKKPTIDSKDKQRAYVLCMETQNQIINNFNEIILNIRAPHKSLLLPFQEGILISNNSLPLLYEYIKEHYKIKYIPTFRLNQNIIEHLISSIRANVEIDDYPTCLEFKYRLRSYLFANLNKVCQKKKLKKN